MTHPHIPTPRMEPHTPMERSLLDDLDMTLIDVRACVTAFIYSAGALYAGVATWKGVVIAAIVLLATIFHYGRRTLIQGGILIMILWSAVWSGAVPPPDKWPGVMTSVLTTVRYSIEIQLETEVQIDIWMGCGLDIDRIDPCILIDA